jgi:hypothetical protein
MTILSAVSRILLPGVSGEKGKREGNCGHCHRVELVIGSGGRANRETSKISLDKCGILVSMR